MYFIVDYHSDLMPDSPNSILIALRVNVPGESVCGDCMYSHLLVCIYLMFFELEEIRALVTSVFAAYSYIVRKLLYKRPGECNVEMY